MRRLWNAGKTKAKVVLRLELLYEVGGSHFVDVMPRPFLRIARDGTEQPV